MKRAKRPLPIPEYEFGFVSETFNLFSEATADGERIARERAELEQTRRAAEAIQAPLLVARTPPPKLAFPFRLRVGDVVRFENQPCTVLHVSDCAAVIAVARPPKEFSTIFGRIVRIQPKPALVRISSNSLIPILSREANRIK